MQLKHHLSTCNSVCIVIKNNNNNNIKNNNNNNIKNNNNILYKLCILI